MQYRYPNTRSMAKEPEEKKRRTNEPSSNESTEQMLASPHTFSAIAVTQQNTEEGKREQLRQDIRRVAKEMKKPLMGKALSDAIDHFLHQECTDETIRAYLNAPQGGSLKQEVEVEDKTTGPDLHAPILASSSAKWKSGDPYTDPHYPQLQATVDQITRSEDGGNLLYLSLKGGPKLVYNEQQRRYYEAESFVDGEDNTQADMGKWTGGMSGDHYYAGQLEESPILLDTQEAMNMHGAQTLDSFIADQVRARVPLDKMTIDPQASGASKNKQEDDLRRFRELIEGIQKSAVIPPIQVHLEEPNATSDSQKWSLVNGGHRIFAAYYLNYKKVPAQSN